MFWPGERRRTCCFFEGKGEAWSIDYRCSGSRLLAVCIKGKSSAYRPHVRPKLTRRGMKTKRAAAVVSITGSCESSKTCRFLRRCLRSFKQLASTASARLQQASQNCVSATARRTRDQSNKRRVSTILHGGLAWSDKINAKPAKSLSALSNSCCSRCRASCLPRLASASVCFCALQFILPPAAQASLRHPRQLIRRT